MLPYSHISCIVFAKLVVGASLHVMQLLTSTASFIALVVSLCSRTTTLAPAHSPSHNYTFEELQPQSNREGSFQQSYFRFNIFFRKNTGITEEFFHGHWKTVHADLTVSNKDAGLRLLRYTQVSLHFSLLSTYTDKRQQFHQDEMQRVKIKPLIDATGGLLAIAPYDGIAEFLTKDYETFEQFVMQIFLNPVMVDDQQSFVDASTAMHVMAGYDYLVFGDAFSASQGKDGILPSDPRLVYSW